MMNKRNEAQRNKDLWDRILSGDDEAFATLYSLYADKLYSYGLRFTFNQELVKDCVQEIFIKLYTGRKRLNQVENVKTYLMSSMKNILFNYFKKENSHYQIDSIEPIFYTEFTGESRLIESEQLYAQKKKIAQMLKHLTPRQREALYYRFEEDLSYEEICQLMQMNYQSVRNLIYRTLLKIRTTVEEVNHEIEKTPVSQNEPLHLRIKL
ncbi:MAG: RNA polymerase sigma factor [Tannerellaceae bacterium]|jgi:RNA polymerase sigma factor (sigma-70 family)|nr:RNA polymerase sigma factor [Tannerellaceae bacterium]